MIVNEIEIQQLEAEETMYLSFLVSRCSIFFLGLSRTRHS